MNANHLLFWLSARREGSWQQFRSAVEQMHFETAARMSGTSPDEQDSGLPVYWEHRYNLQRLGHADFADQKWRVAPPVLAAIPKGDRWVGVLCGARLPALIDRIRQAGCGCTVVETPQESAPDLITVAADAREPLHEFAGRAGLHLQMDAGRAVMAIVPPVDDPRCQRTCEIPAGDGWEVKRFSVSSLAWKDSSRAEAAAASFGLFRFEHHNQRQCVVCRRGRASRVNVQVGKFLALKARRRRRGILHYDAGAELLSAPLTCHPPPVLYRALVLCAGTLPRNDGGILRFSSVAEDVATCVAQLLRQEIR